MPWPSHEMLEAIATNVEGAQEQKIGALNSAFSRVIWTRSKTHKYINH